MITCEMLEVVARRIIDATSVEYVDIRLGGSIKDGSLFDSKFGGLPYLASDSVVPVDGNGVPLALLAQINCGDLPVNELYPKSGLLQFWIGRDDIMGLDDKMGSRVVYYTDVDRSVSVESVLERYPLLDNSNDEEYSPFTPKDISFSLEFEKSVMAISSSDERFEPLVIKTINELYPDEKIEDLYADIDNEILYEFYERFSGANHCIGGYPTFIQWDPRDFGGDKDYYVLLLQIESEWNRADNAEIMWGDAGVGNFFISKEDLKDLNFDEVLFNWDCS